MQTTTSTARFLSTPSGWRATPKARGSPEAPRISIHALRVEGDKCTVFVFYRASGFLSTPSGWRATGDGFPDQSRTIHFYPRPPGGGRPPIQPLAVMLALFLSTPSGWRATERLFWMRSETCISIHALRVEGDYLAKHSGEQMSSYFYPRPPGGGRHTFRQYFSRCPRFLSTPSGWRATQYPDRRSCGIGISIHALRVEGDRIGQREGRLQNRFLSTPSGWRATWISFSPTPSKSFLSTPSGWRATRGSALAV